ncbi:ubiquitin carboxyl-terminal hydrolase-like protein [Lasiosphaeria hispida]|uniref:ubiquitinyl hydrolase 1 n=1 Tax=Lasiosphaeria hispida TaxID=260671 RepID=A0AAJ0MB55_9PEZI|nr:ubiquitin carboxyl-terminal hydrolase-like protein [Lasiosphaeria hispida]
MARKSTKTQKLEHPGEAEAVHQPQPDGEDDIGGRLANRLIRDLVAGQIRYNPRVVLPPNHKSKWSCPKLRHPYWRIDNAGDDHDIIVVASQSSEILNPYDAAPQVLSCICRFCRYHFTFTVFAGHNEQSSVCAATYDRLQHHFQGLSYSESSEGDAESNPLNKLNPSCCTIRYACSNCPFAVEFELSAPRLKSEWIQLITDETRIRNALYKLRKADGDRYGDISKQRETFYETTPLATLNAYLTNVLEEDGSGDAKRISFRNKTFSIQFGLACEHIFRYLEFSVITEETSAGEEKYWVQPRLPPQFGKTPTGSRRAFFEDVKFEVQSLLEQRPPPSVPRAVILSHPVRAADRLFELVGAPFVPGKVAAWEGDVDDFHVLGASSNDNDDTIWWAYNRQLHLDGLYRKVYHEALGKIALGRQSDKLQLFWAGKDEEVDRPALPATARDEVAAAYAHFRLEDKRHDPSAAPDVFLDIYQTYRNKSYRQRAEHRTNLLTIGEDRQSKEIRDAAKRNDMDLEEACELLKTQAGSQLAFATATAKRELHKNRANPDLGQVILLALQTIIDSGTWLGDAEHSAEAKALIATHRADSLGRGDSPGNCEQGAETVNMPLPVAVGLANLRNTCYLNSILQYFFSVKAVRDLVLHSQQPTIEPTVEGLDALLHGIASSDLEPGRAFVGIEFSRELGSLFKELESATGSAVTPRQRLANAALLRPEKVVKNPATGPIGPPNKDAPPLPPRAGDSSQPTVTVDAVNENSETASMVSSQTLVNKPEDDTSYVLVSPGAENPDPEAMEVDAPNAPDAPTASNSKLTVEELAVELDKPNVGSDQMDVDEVMGNAFDHLRAAFKVSEASRSGCVPDPIEKAFFSTFIDNRKKLGDNVWNRTTRSDRWVTAYPARKGTRSLYDAMEVSFDLERLPSDLLSFTTIDKPAPNFHICIQRSDGVRKNSNPLKIPETLYLDRFMHRIEGDEDTTIAWDARKRAWDIKTRLNETEHLDEGEPGKESTTTNVTTTKSIEEGSPSSSEVDDYTLDDGSDSPHGESNGNASRSKYSVANVLLAGVLDGYPSLTSEPTLPAGADSRANGNGGGKKIPTLPPATVQNFWDTLRKLEQQDRTDLIAEKDGAFSTMKKFPYRLHAVVCHAGATASAGHYWVWIRDFEKDVWRKFNDTTVSVHDATYVFWELCNKGEPYYLAYVRESEIKDLVSTPQRRFPIESSSDDSEMPDASDVPKGKGEATAPDAGKDQDTGAI